MGNIEKESVNFLTVGSEAWNTPPFLVRKSPKNTTPPSEDGSLQHEKNIKRRNYKLQYLSQKKIKTDYSKVPQPTKG